MRKWKRVYTVEITLKSGRQIVSDFVKFDISYNLEGVTKLNWETAGLSFNIVAGDIVVARTLKVRWRLL